MLVPLLFDDKRIPYLPFKIMQRGVARLQGKVKCGVIVCHFPGPELAAVPLNN